MEPYMNAMPLEATTTPYVLIPTTLIQTWRVCKLFRREGHLRQLFLFPETECMG